MAGEENAFAVTDIITHVIYVRQGDVWPCIDELGEIGIQCYGVDCADIREPFITEARAYNMFLRVRTKAGITRYCRQYRSSLKAANSHMQTSRLYVLIARGTTKLHKAKAPKNVEEQRSEPCSYASGVSRTRLK